MNYFTLDDFFLSKKRTNFKNEAVRFVFRQTLKSQTLSVVCLSVRLNCFLPSFGLDFRSRLLQCSRRFSRLCFMLISTCFFFSFIIETIITTLLFTTKWSLLDLALKVIIIKRKIWPTFLLESLRTNNRSDQTIDRGLWSRICSVSNHRIKWEQTKKKRIFLNLESKRKVPNLFS